MNPGPVEEAGSTARQAVEALKSTPVVLALVIFNVLYMGFGAYTQIRDRDHQVELLKTWANEHAHTADLLAKCVITPEGTGAR